MPRAINPVMMANKLSNDAAYGAGTYSANGETVAPYYIYDTLDIPNAAKSVRMFQQQIGTGTTPKTLADTNMLVSGQIPARQKMVIQAVHLYYNGALLTGVAKDTLAAGMLYRMLSTTFIEFIIANKTSLFVSTLQMLLGAPMLFNVPDTTDSFAQPSYRGVTPWRIPQTLAENTPFEWKVTFTETPGAYIQGDRLTLAMNTEFKFAT